ncbi:hypothetical protein CVT26_002939 [Gymnopilus dilepis]|uniref:GATA-type domain-containing protein n=1 Tax=Gymnopilus dilepis TaxID=231916 RepID=A0A409Y4M2_9AGAR|nr:hypothetical protein CVT26_002939 [Gymnopilus dilepis]
MGPRFLPCSLLPQYTCSLLFSSSRVLSLHHATTLWRKDDERKTVCNVCGLHYKLYGSARPVFMKCNNVCQCFRHDARRSGPSEEIPSTSPGVSRRTSPVPESSSTFAPESTTQMSYDYSDGADL